MKTLLKFPEFRQAYDWDCGAAAIQSILAYYGIDEREGKIIKLAGTNQKTGTPTSGLKLVVKKYGLDCKAGKMTIEGIKKYLDKKIPVIVLLQAWTKKKDVDWKNEWGEGHYVVVIGYDAKKLYFADSADIKRTFLDYEEFANRWHDRLADKKYINWGMTVFGKKAKFDLSKAEHMG